MNNRRILLCRGLLIALSILIVGCGPRGELAEGIPLHCRIPDLPSRGVPETVTCELYRDYILPIGIQADQRKPGHPGILDLRGVDIPGLRGASYRGIAKHLLSLLMPKDIRKHLVQSDSKTWPWHFTGDSKGRLRFVSFFNGIGAPVSRVKFSIWKPYADGLASEMWARVYRPISTGRREILLDARTAFEKSGAARLAKPGEPVIQVTLGYLPQSVHLPQPSPDTVTLHPVWTYWGAGHFDGVEKINSQVFRVHAVTGKFFTKPGLLPEPFESEEDAAREP